MKSKIYQLIFVVLVLLSSFKIAAQDNKPAESSTTYSAVIIVNTEFKYQVVLKTMIAVQPTAYKLSKFPEGMTIDEKTGLIKWTPKIKGEFTAQVDAYLNANILESVILKLKVVEALGVVNGVVKSSDGTPLQYAYVTLYKKMVVAGKPDSYVGVASASTDATGAYKIANIELGTYIAYAAAKSTDATVGYQPAYYVNATTIDKATPINVSSATPVEVNFSLQKFTITPTVIISYSATIKIGVEFKYQVDVKLPNGVTSAIYRLTARPDGMLINEKTGLVTWTPKTKGEFSAQVTVTSNDQKIALVNMKIKVVGFSGSITGTVTDSDNKPLQYISIILYKKVSTAEKANSIIGSSSSITDVNGKYTIADVDSGAYYVYAKPNAEKSTTAIASSYLPVYYDNAQTIDKATAVPVINTTPVTINFKLQKYVKPEPVKASIAGTVFDNSGKPIAGAVVTVTQSKPASSGNVVDGYNFLVAQNATTCSIADVTSDIKTDASGKYSISLTAGGVYIVSCSAQGFLNQYYSGKTNLLDANKITLKRDTTGIDFKLTPVPVAKAIVSGSVVDSIKTPVPAKVILFPNSLTMPPISSKDVRTVSTNDKGEFSFEKVPNGKYSIQVVPLKDYLPAYYKQNDCGAREVKQADIITVENDANVSNLIVCVKKVKVTGGGKISGYIKSSFGEPIEGAVVIAESSGGTDLSFDISDTDGSYSIDNLGVGVYNVYSDKVGYTNSFANDAVIDYQKNQFNTQVDLLAGTPTITDVKNAVSLPTNFELKQNYPNPFNPSTIINWQITESCHVLLKVYDMLGREVATLVDEFKQPGVYNSLFSIQHSQLSSGVYFYTLRAGNFVQTKKMLLTK